MVKFTAATSVAVLAATANAAGNRHAHLHNKRSYPIESVEVSTSTIYPETYPVASTYAVVETHCGVVVVTVTAPAPVASTPAASTEAASTPCESSTTPIGLQLYETQPVPSSTPAADTSYPAASYPASSYSVSSPASYPTSAPIGGSKKGIVYNSGDECTPFKPYSSSIPWAWNWDSNANGMEGYEYVPALNNKAQLDRWKSNVDSAQNIKALLSFNEADMNAAGGGSALSPSEAASLYKQHMMPYADQYQLGCPSVTSHNASTGGASGVTPYSGITWLQQFKAACDGCKVDFCPLHWYGAAGQSGSQQAEAFKTYFDQAVKDCQCLWPGAKVWVNEFSALPTINQDNSGVNEEFMKSVIPYLESNPDVERYSYFFASPNYLVDNNGGLTSAGKTYCETS